VKLAVQNNV